MATVKMTERVNHFQLQSILEDQFLEGHKFALCPQICSTFYFNNLYSCIWIIIHLYVLFCQNEFQILDRKNEIGCSEKKNKSLVFNWIYNDNICKTNSKIQICFIEKFFSTLSSSLIFSDVLDLNCHLQCVMNIQKLTCCLLFYLGASRLYK